MKLWLQTLLCFCTAVSHAFLSFEKFAASGITKDSRTVPSSFQQQEFHAFEAQGFEFYPTSAISLETKTVLQFTSLDLALSYLVSRQWVSHLMSFALFWAVLQTSLHLGQVKIGSRFCCTAWISSPAWIWDRNSLKADHSGCAADNAKQSNKLKTT